MRVDVFNNMDFKLELSLEQLTMVKKSVLLWGQEDMKHKVEEIYAKENIRTEPITNEKAWNHLTKELLNQIDSITLPPSLKFELVNVIRSVGSKIFNWKEYVTNKLNCPISFAQEIKWTIYGSIDKIKIFNLFWLNNPSFDVSTVFNVACNFCIEEQIATLWKQIPKEQQESFFYSIRIYDKYKYHLIAYWKHFINRDLSSFIAKLKTKHDRSNMYNSEKSVEENMFKLAVSEGYDLAANYFWNKMYDLDKEKQLKPLAATILKKSDYVGHPTIWFKKNESFMHILLFLMSAMPEDDRAALFEEHKMTLLEIFLSIWPWQYFFQSTLDELRKHFSEMDFKNLIRNIVFKMTEDYNLGYPIQNSKYQKILHQVWNTSLPALKQTIDTAEWTILKYLLEIKDITSMNLIINDPDMKEQRDQLLYKGKWRYWDLIHEDRCDLLEEFLDTILLTDEERKRFGAFIKVYYFLWKDQYELADQFLNSQYNTQDEIDTFKETFAQHHADYSLTNVLCFWCYFEEKEEARKRYAEFLKWCFVTDKRVLDFKEEIELNMVHRELYRVCYVCSHTTDEFLEWCLYPSESI